MQGFQLISPCFYLYFRRLDNPPNDSGQGCDDDDDDVEKEEEDIQLERPRLRLSMSQRMEAKQLEASHHRAKVQHRRVDDSPPPAMNNR